MACAYGEARPSTCASSPGAPVGLSLEAVEESAPASLDLANRRTDLLGTCHLTRRPRPGWRTPASWRTITMLKLTGGGVNDRV